MESFMASKIEFTVLFYNPNIQPREEYEMRKSEDINSFYEILSFVLKKYHNSDPAHNREELKLLRSRFPDQIKLYMAYIDNNPVAGVLKIFETDTVVHSQYIASNDDGRKFGL